MEYNLSGKVSFDDYVQYQYAQIKTSSFKNFRLILFLIIFIIFAINIYPHTGMLILYIKTSPFDFFKNFIPLIAVLIFFFLIEKIGLPIFLRKLYNANKLWQYKLNIKINEQYISINTEIENINISKENIFLIIYDNDSIYIWIKYKIVHILKKRFLENENDFEELKNFIKHNYRK
jgi:hypothetical protein